MKEDEKDILRTWSRDFGMALSPGQMDLFGLYLDALWEWNRKFNLTGLSSRKEIVQELLIDSLIPVPFLPQEGRFLDVGSGAGFPAIPLKICKPGLEALLIEASAKKVSFLKQVIRAAGLPGIEVVRGRIEKEGNHLIPERQAIITARALAPLPRTLAWCAPYAASQGMI
ncbi:MAG: 16S rRNA (guanine(527)-N(7))-methyltransferase RsmG, partial [Deltaproteobacteria bacterium]|nr:16S rRNA (guanine(527)-N(7))-methyltransferase RsmG [Deltaproteobacteria bacterium]